MTFLFWNIRKKPIFKLVRALASEHRADIVALVECPKGERDDLLSELNADASREFLAFEQRDSDIQLFSCLGPQSVVERFTDHLGNLLVRELRPAGSPPILLVLLHFPSRVNWERADQTMEATAVARDIALVESDLGHSRTVLVGDLNMNPFDDAVVGSHGFHAVMTHRLAARAERQVQERRYPMFYNPMWGLFGDRTPGPSGTYYLKHSKPVNTFWNIYDQVLIRPDLVDRLLDVRILDRVSDQSLLTRSGLPQDSVASDHLPLLFSLDLQGRIENGQ